MSKNSVIDAFVTLDLETDLWELIKKIDETEAHLFAEIPHELLVTHSGDPNTTSFWGSVLRNIRLTRSTIKVQLQHRR